MHLSVIPVADRPEHARLMSARELEAHLGRSQDLESVAQVAAIEGDPTATTLHAASRVPVLSPNSVLVAVTNNWPSVGAPSSGGAVHSRRTMLELSRAKTVATRVARRKSVVLTITLVVLCRGTIRS